ncbi:hypothetical protein [Psychroflexus sp. ALD_RP9]|uniref:hypothetical protein n=1 Tax=Psychroflexus sp. ALD_RP9 TaxID=2777186 RepID=UPI001A8D0B40|nr:hypothetical protein [Psychroflexus sp. ALD_RP9]QSS98062.1 hypothetical protein IMZ30_04935 [Psychroflexus sp. ALD_RP9]
MKFFIRFLLVFALGFLIYNLVIIDYASPLTGHSFDSVIASFIALAAIILLIILRLSQSLKEKYEEGSN